ncbi:hypothetical protein PEC106664_32010 [Pectobacterium carotovorum subsp. carotovorum]|nr:hypothetical protein PEC106664_32010 [Pectobacterium carotovorum subsp. carotovorum]
MAISKSSNSLLDKHLKQVKRYFNLFWREVVEVGYVR